MFSIMSVTINFNEQESPTNVSYQGVNYTEQNPLDGLNHYAEDQWQLHGTTSFVVNGYAVQNFIFFLPV